MSSLRISVFALTVLILATGAIVFADEGVSLDNSAVLSDSTVTQGKLKAATDGRSEFYPLSPERREQLISYSRLVNIWRFIGFTAYKLSKESTI